MQDYYYTCGGTAAAFFCSSDRVASVFITCTEFQTSIIKTPKDTPERLARFRKHTEITKEKFFLLYDAAVAMNKPGKQEVLKFLAFPAE